MSDLKNFTVYDVTQKEISEWKIAALRSHKRASEWARDALNAALLREKEPEGNGAKR